MSKIKVLVVDDSPIVRSLLTKELTKDNEIEVVGTAIDAFNARDQIVNLKPDVVTLDVEMPKMDGITFLSKLMKAYPIPVIIVSALTHQGCALALEALENGAVDVVEKPMLADSQGLTEFATILIDKIKAASQVKFSGSASQRFIKKSTRIVNEKPAGTKLGIVTNKIIAVGASTGGTEALKEFLATMPIDCPPIMIVQHMPGTFTKAFADRLNRQTPIEVLEAESGMELKQGRAIIANGNLHLTIKKSPNSWQAECKDGPLVCRHRPSVEVLFNSFSKLVGKYAIGVMLTGMGKDGAEAMKKMHDAGAKTIAQDEKSCVVYGMPKEAVKLGAVDKIVPLNKITSTVLSYL